jgi:hypothetical protein
MTLDELITSPVKRLFFRLFAWGAGCALTMAVITVAIFFYEQRPKPWDAHALRVKHAKAEPLSRVNEKFEEVSSGISFTADVENTTAADITLPSTLTAMGQTRGSYALHRTFLKLRGDYFLPAGHVTTISLDSDDLCAANHPPQQCFDSYFKDDEGLVIFDELHKYEMLIPVPILTLPRSQTTVTVSPETPAPPCKDGAATCDPWERDWSKGKPKLGSIVTKQGGPVQPH